MNHRYNLRCNVRSLWDLWLFGNTVENIAPYRMLHVWDLGTKTDSSLLSKAAKVIQKLEQIATERDPTIQLRQLTTATSRAVFAAAFDALSILISTRESIEDIDRRHYGESSYLTIYDLINKLKNKTQSQALLILLI